MCCFIRHIGRAVSRRFYGVEFVWAKRHSPGSIVARIGGKAARRGDSGVLGSLRRPASTRGALRMALVFSRHF